MSTKSVVSTQFVVGVLTKARLILLFMAVSVFALIYSDIYTRGLMG